MKTESIHEGAKSLSVNSKHCLSLSTHIIWKLTAGADNKQLPEQNTCSVRLNGTRLFIDWYTERILVSLSSTNIWTSVDQDTFTGEADFTYQVLILKNLTWSEFMIKQEQIYVKGVRKIYFIQTYFLRPLADICFCLKQKLILFNFSEKQKFISSFFISGKCILIKGCLVICVPAAQKQS